MESQIDNQPIEGERRSLTQHLPSWSHNVWHICLQGSQEAAQKKDKKILKRTLKYLKMHRVVFQMHCLYIFITLIYLQESVCEMSPARGPGTDTLAVFLVWQPGQEDNVFLCTPLHCDTLSMET